MHSHSLISAFVIHCLDSTISVVSVCKISNLYLVSIAEQASLSITWSQTPKTGFLVTWLNYIVLLNDLLECVCSAAIYKWAAAWQNQQNDLCAQQKLRSAWPSAQSDQSLLCAQWVAKDQSFLQADSKDSDQTGWMSTLISVFAGRKGHCVGFVLLWLKLHVFCYEQTQSNQVWYILILYDFLTSKGSEPPHDKSNKMACGPSEDSDQPGHPPNLIRVFSVCMKKTQVLSYPMSPREDSYQTGQMPRPIWIFAGRTCCFVGFEIRWLI